MRPGFNQNTPKIWEKRYTSDHHNSQNKVGNGGETLPFCPKCGTELPNDARFCPSCGTAVGKVVTEEFSVSAEDLIAKVKQLIHEGNVTRIIIKDDKGNNLLEIPATVGVVGALLAPWLAALGVIAALVTRCTIAVERRE